MSPERAGAVDLTDSAPGITALAYRCGPHALEIIERRTQYGIDSAFAAGTEDDLGRWLTMSWKTLGPNLQSPGDLKAAQARKETYT